MRTEELIQMLASGSGAAEPVRSARRLSSALALGTLAAAALMWSVLGLRADLKSAAIYDPMFWVKVAFTSLSAAGGVLAVSRLGRPGARLTWVPVGLAAPLVAVWLLAAFELLTARPGERTPLIFGETWLACPFGIMLLSAPVFVAVLWALRGLAPTRLELAGAAAGLAAGTVGALLYALHCPEVAAPFVGVWYVVGMLIPAAVGGIVGRKVLGW